VEDEENISYERLTRDMVERRGEERRDKVTETVKAARMRNPRPHGKSKALVDECGA